MRAIGGFSLYSFAGILRFSTSSARYFTTSVNIFVFPVSSTFDG